MATDTVDVHDIDFVDDGTSERDGTGGDRTQVPLAQRSIEIADGVARQRVGARTRRDLAKADEVDHDTEADTQADARPIKDGVDANRHRAAAGSRRAPP